MRYLFICIVLFVVGCTPAPADDVAQIRNVLAQQAERWNDGDIEGYMTGYWNNDSLLFIGRGGPGYGYNNTLERYKKGYPDKATMGHLDFDNLSLNRLCDNYYHVTGRYKLTRDEADAMGYFTLIFKKIEGKWVIIADHSS